MTAMVQIPLLFGGVYNKPFERWQKTCHVLHPSLVGSGSYENDSPVSVVAVKKEEKAGLMQDI